MDDQEAEEYLKEKLIILLHLPLMISIQTHQGPFYFELLPFILVHSRIIVWCRGACISAYKSICA